jgi:UDPglucose 6-dehydrogenase
MANFCEKTGADIVEVAKGMSLDSRIGAKFLNPGPGYGGSCFPKDTCAISYMAKMNGADLTLIDAAIKGNAERKTEMAKRIAASVKGIKEPHIAVWGLAFKGGTDDCRESPAIAILNELIELRIAEITVFDPKAMANAKLALGGAVMYAKNEYEAVKDADILVILTEWADFKNADLSKVKTAMKTPKILDLRNILDASKSAQLGFEYRCIGK